MFDNKLFEEWLDKEANKAMQKVVSGKAITTNETTILALKGQASYLARRRKHFRDEAIKLRKNSSFADL